MNIPTVIVLDGPAGAGKSTVAKAISRLLDISYLDTGAMYRALTLKALRQNINLEDESRLVELARQTAIDFAEDGNGGLSIRLDGQIVAEEIRSLDVTNNTFYIARTPGVRAILVDWQREIASTISIVAEGRDLGTVVFPEATYKFFLDANVEERVRRRVKELQEKGLHVDEGQIRADMIERDHKDSSRAVGPLKKADDAVTIDSTGLTAEGTAKVIVDYISAHPKQ